MKARWMTNDRRNLKTGWTSDARNGRRRDFGLTGGLVLLAAQLAWTAPAFGQWSALPNMPQPRTRHVAAGGLDFSGAPRVFVLGGTVGSTPTVAVDAYDPVAGAWDPPGTYSAMPTLRVSPAVAVDSAGLIYVIGGYASGGALASIDVYDPATDLWGTIAAMPTARANAGAAFGNDGKLYVAGGGDGTGANIYNVLEAYDPATLSWATKPPMPGTHENVGAALGCDGALYVVGARNSAQTCPSGGSVTYRYDPALPGWTVVAPMPGCLGGRGVVRGPDDRIYAVNDGDFFTFDTQVYSYDSLNDAWSAEPSTISGYTDLAVAALGDRIYALGGSYHFPSDPTRFEELVTGTASICTPPCAQLLPGVFSDDRFSAFPADRMQVVAMYDGDGTANLDIELWNPTTGDCCTLSIAGINNTDILTQEYDLMGYEPSGRFDIGGVIANGAIDGVAFGLYVREPAALGGKRWLLRSADQTLPSSGVTPNFVGMWPIAWSEATWDAKMTLPPPTGFARRQAQCTLAGAQLLPNGTWSVPTGRIVGDVDGDGCVNLTDLAILLSAFDTGACCP